MFTIDQSLTTNADNVVTVDSLPHNLLFDRFRVGDFVFGCHFVFCVAVARVELVELPCARWCGMGFTAKQG